MSRVSNILIKPTTQIEVVQNFNALPNSSLAIGLFYWCTESQGTAWLPFNLGGTFYNSGLYYSNGVEWTFQKTPFGATQIEVNAGLNNDKFLTAFTFENASKWNSKISINNYIRNEIPSGLINGSNMTYTSLNNFIINTLEVFLNGQLLKIIDDYNTTGVNTILLNISPLNGEKIIINYIKE